MKSAHAWGASRRETATTGGQGEGGRQPAPTIDEGGYEHRERQELQPVATAATPPPMRRPATSERATPIASHPLTLPLKIANWSG